MRSNNIRLLVIDNASDTFDASEIERVRVRGFMRELSRVARDTGAAVILLSHVDKITSRWGAQGGAASEAYSGSTAWHNSARSRLFLERDSKGLMMLSQQKNNLGRLAHPLTLEWPEGGLMQPVGGAQPAQETDEHAPMRALLRLIDEFTRRGEFVASSQNSRTHAVKLLAQEAEYPRGCKPAEVFAILRQAERERYLTRVEYKGADRKLRERWEVTPVGASFAASAASAAQGVWGKERAHQPGAPLAADDLTAPAGAFA